MLLSVVVPTRNRSALLLRCLAHLQKQTQAEMEVIVVDDGSDVATRGALNAAWPTLDTRFRLIESAPAASSMTSGPSAVRNLGLLAARGTLLAFCDDDDLWIDPEHAARVVRLFEAHPELDLFIANQRVVHVDGRTREDWLPELTEACRTLPPVEPDIHAVTPRLLCRSGGFGHMNMVTLRKSLLDRMDGRFWTRVSYEEDRDFFWRAVDRARSIMYTTRVAAQHHVPDPARRVNVSTTFSTTERWLVANLVSQHIVANVAHADIVRLCSHHQGDLLRRLAGVARSESRHGAAARWAWQALGARFSWKWSLVCIAYTLRAALKP